MRAQSEPALRLCSGRGGSGKRVRKCKKMQKKRQKGVKPQHKLDLTIGVIGAWSFNKLTKMQKKRQKVSKSAKKCEK